MTSAQVVAFYTSRAEAVGGVQVFRQDGSPLVGDIRAPITWAKVKRKGQCNLLCCSQDNGPVQPPPGLVSRAYSFLPEEKFSQDWVKVQHRSERRLKKRSDMNQKDVVYAIMD